MEEASRVPGKREVLWRNCQRSEGMAVKAADEEDDLERLAVEAFLGAIS